MAVDTRQHSSRYSRMRLDDAPDDDDAILTGEELNKYLESQAANNQANAPRSRFGRYRPSNNEQPKGVIPPTGPAIASTEGFHSYFYHLTLGMLESTLSIFLMANTVRSVSTCSFSLHMILFVLSSYTSNAVTYSNYSFPLFHILCINRFGLVQCLRCWWCCHSFCHPPS